MTSYPVEKYIDLENNPYLLGRITVHQVNEDYHAEVDIIHKEPHKIFKHVDMIYRQPSGEEALIEGIQRLKHYLDSLKKQDDDRNSNFH